MITRSKKLIIESADKYRGNNSTPVSVKRAKEQKNLLKVLGDTEIESSEETEYLQNLSNLEKLSWGDSRESLDPERLRAAFEMANEAEVSNFIFERFNKIMPIYDGSEITLNKFLDCADLVTIGLNPQGLIEFANFIVIKLSGRAYDLFKNHDYTNWANFKILLKGKFEKKKSLSFIQTELIGIRQGHNESVRSYADKIEKKLTEMNKASREIKIENRDAGAHFAVWHEGLALRTFQDGLMGSLKLLIKARNYQSLTEAINGALEEELYEKDFRRSGTGDDRAQTKDFNVTCFKCGKVGHISRNCNEGFRENIICYTCNKPGHLSTECYKNNQQNNNEFRVNNKSFDDSNKYKQNDGRKRINMVNLPEQSNDILSYESKNGVALATEDLNVVRIQEFL